MTIDQLIERLQEAREEIGGDCEVRLMTQQNWPFENAVHGVTTSNQIAESSEDDEDDEDDEPAEPVCFIVEGSQLAYGTKTAWEVC